MYWNIHANDFGYAEITIHYTKLDNSPGSFTFPVWVNEDVYEMWIDSSTGTENILPGGEMNLIAYMNHYAFDQEEEYLPGDLKDRVTLCWDYKDQKQNRDVLTITQDMEDQRICHIAVKDNITDDLDIHLVLHAYEKMIRAKTVLPKMEKAIQLSLHPVNSVYAYGRSIILWSRKGCIIWM